MTVTVRIPTPLRNVTGGVDKVSVQGNILREIIASLEAQFPGIEGRLCDDEGELRNFVNIYINGEDVRFLEGLSTSTNEGDEVSIVPAVAGGQMSFDLGKEQHSLTQILEDFSCPGSYLSDNLN